VATFCLLHGAWHGPSCWSPVAERLEAHGHGAVVPDLPLHVPAADYEDRIRPAVDALEDAEEPVIVVAHSQSSALGPLVAVATPVSVLIYVCPRMGGLEPPSGAPRPFRDNLEFPPDRDDGTSAWDPEVAIATIYARLPDEWSRRLAQRLRPMAMPAGDYPLREHPEVPTALIYATEDEFFTPDFERFMARELLHVEPVELRSGHFPMIEDPDSLTELLCRMTPG
jgi:pimeloyl-ACP methyl ester carboxylesterase